MVRERWLPAALALVLCAQTALPQGCFFGDAHVVPASISASYFSSAANSRAASSAKRREQEAPPARPSANELQDVEHAWWTVKQSLPLKYLSTTIFLTFLKLYPEYLKDFTETGEEQAMEALLQNKAFVSKSLAFMYDMASMLDNLDDPELVEVMAGRVGQRRQRDGASTTSFDDIRNLILHLVGRYHKQYALRFPLGIVESTTRTLNWIFETMKKSFDPQSPKAVLQKH